MIINVLAVAKSRSIEKFRQKTAQKVQLYIDKHKENKMIINKLYLRILKSVIITILIKLLEHLQPKAKP
jgi:hypothetical protein